MTELPPPPPPPPFGASGPWPAMPPPPPPGARARRWWPVALVGIVLLLAAASVALVLRSDGPDHPEAWDPRVADLADFVERARDLDFDHPVHVDFLTDEEYSELATTDEEALDDESRSELDRYAGMLRAMGLASGELDLFEAYNQVSDAGTLAFYDPADQRVRVRGTTMTVGMEVTLVHELTHALQDQHFDLGQLDDPDLENGAAVALRALVEGDAVRIEEEYVADVLDEADQAAYDEEYASELEESLEATDEVPGFVSASFGVPYALGAPFVQLLVSDDGNEAVDDAFGAPPDSEDDLFDPTSYLADEDEQEVELDLDDDVEVLEDGTFGSPSWHLLLAERIDPMVAFEATRGWDGDAYANFERDGRACVRAVFAGDSDDDERQMADALDAWLAALPGGEAEVIEVDGHPGFDACDPGEDVDMELTERSDDALAVPAVWGYLVADAASVLDVEGARCYGERVLAAITFEELIDPEGAAFDTEEFQQTIQDAFTTCS